MQMHIAPAAPLTEEAALEIATLRLLSSGSKLITLFLDPSRRKEVKITRSDIVSFFDQVDASCRDQIHEIKQHHEAL